MIVFLSPHFDDAVYSCGGTIHQLTQQGKQVHVITTMAGTPTHIPDTPIVRDLHQRWGGHTEPVAVRANEDRLAVSMLGASVGYLSIPDCVYRTDATGHALYPDEQSLWGRPHPHDPALAQLQAWSFDEVVEKLYIPLAIGQHVDHVILHEWAVWYTKRHQWEASRVFFYADYPYAERQVAVEARLQTVRAGCPSLHMLEEPLSEKNLQAKIKAMQAYHSQVSTFWQDEQALAQSMQAYHQRQHAQDAVFTEQYYQCF